MDGWIGWEEGDETRRVIAFIFNLGREMLIGKNGVGRRSNFFSSSSGSDACESGSERQIGGSV